MASWLRTVWLRRIVSMLIVFVLACAPIQVFAAGSGPMPHQMATAKCDAPNCPCDAGTMKVDCAKMAACLVKCSSATWLPQTLMQFPAAFDPPVHRAFEPHPLLSAIAEPLRRPPRA